MKTPKMFNSKEFHDLRKEWYKKLKEEGFEDVEWQSSHGTQSPYMKRSTGSIRRKHRFETEQYYQIVANFATHYPFDSNLESVIMQKHALGWSYRRISKHLRAEYGTKGMIACPATICNKLKKLREIMFDWDQNNIEGLTFTRQLFEDYETY